MSAIKTIKNIKKYPKNPGRKNIEDTEYAWIEKHILRKSKSGTVDSAYSADTIGTPVALGTNNILDKIEKIEKPGMSETFEKRAFNKPRQIEFNILLDKILRQDNVRALEFLFDCGFEEDKHLAKDEYLGRLVILLEAEKCLDFLNQKKYDFSRPILNGEDFLQYASRIGSRKSIDKLIAMTPPGEDISPIRAPKFINALHTALLAGYPELFTYLLDKGVLLLSSQDSHNNYSAHGETNIANYFDAAYAGYKTTANTTIGPADTYNELFIGLERHLNRDNAPGIAVMFQTIDNQTVVPRSFQTKMQNLLSIIEERNLLQIALDANHTENSNNSNNKSNKSNIGEGTKLKSKILKI